MSRADGWPPGGPWDLTTALYLVSTSGGCLTWKRALPLYKKRRKSCIRQVTLKMWPSNQPPWGLAIYRKGKFSGLTSEPPSQKLWGRYPDAEAHYRAQTTDLDGSIRSSCIGVVRSGVPGSPPPNSAHTSARVSFPVMAFFFFFKFHHVPLVR